MGKVDAYDIYIAYREGFVNTTNEYYTTADYEALEAKLAALESELAIAKAGIEAMTQKMGKYDELIYSVGNKYPNESRHETALRYMRNAEKSCDGKSHQARKEE